MLDSIPLIVVSTASAVISLCSAIVGIAKGRDTKPGNEHSESAEMTSEALDRLASDSFSRLLPFLEKLEESDLLRRIELSDLLPRIEQTEEVETTKGSQDI